ncbi:DUF1963 domain-containing protein [Bacteroidales bacterium OttesenSCG-928-K03]|nr:DUF1963 domain-containing protein [Bacteroidales bacterium OttesenSCG-928-L14]MDL2240395.1 DUF1963 domain-containing protein [Bacteroidales bacterium OttesenSCG-928-K22]MDL2242370.1 DUF1963 domain-containing protein [Bacteroidales bacterium OttesenSCG-928-K03]
MNEVIIKAKRTEMPLPVGKSKLWGYPDLPESLDYPTGFSDEGVFPLNFICQINCKDIEPYDIDKKLPNSGILYFFADIDYYFGYFDCPPAGGIGPWPKESIKVLYFDGNEDELIPLMFKKEDVDFLIEERELTFESSDVAENDGLKLLGQPFYLQGHSLEKPYNKMELLFQLDSDEDDDFMLNFMDVGLLYFFIAEKDLKKKNFDNVLAYMMSS